MSDHTPQELMVAVAAREIQDGDLVFVGMRLPILATGWRATPTRPAPGRCSSLA